MRAWYEYRKRRLAARAGKIQDEGYENRSLAYQEMVRLVLAAQREALLGMRRDGKLSNEATRLVAAALEGSDVLLVTSRELRRGRDAAESLEISRRVSAAVTEVVHGALPAEPAWVVAKGGITSQDVAVRGLGIRRATVLGQLFPGLVSVFRPVDAAPEAVGTPYVVFAGNVGDETTLASVIDRFR